MIQLKMKEAKKLSEEEINKRAEDAMFIWKKKINPRSKRT